MLDTIFINGQHDHFMEWLRGRLGFFVIGGGEGERDRDRQRDRQRQRQTDSEWELTCIFRGGNGK